MCKVRTCYKLTEVMAARGRKGTDPRDLKQALEVLAKAAQEKFESSALSARVHREAQGLERSVGNVISMVEG